jgi:hypothetical protein
MPSPEEYALLISIRRMTELVKRRSPRLRESATPELTDAAPALCAMDGLPL